MSMKNATKAKNSGVFIDELQEAFLAESPKEILSALDNPPKLKWSHPTTIGRFGLTLWCGGNVADALKAAVIAAAEDGEFLDAARGCLYLWGDEATRSNAASITESVFELCESTGDYSFNALGMVDVIGGTALDWNGAAEGFCFVRVEPSYLLSTITSVKDDLDASEFEYNAAQVISLAKGYCRAGTTPKATSLIADRLKAASFFDGVTELFYGLEPQIKGLPVKSRSFEAPTIEFAGRSLFEEALNRATQLAKKSDKDALADMKSHIQAYTDEGLL